ncbi:MAG: hypothetical protein IKT39_04825 [Clostridia bacterium]|nr:hypothetical protein [Clostridia bacterium]
MKRKYYSRYELAPVAEMPLPAEKNSLSNIFGNIFSKFEIDDLILIAVILILVTDEQPDTLTILALLYIFLV